MLAKMVKKMRGKDVGSAMIFANEVYTRAGHQATSRKRESPGGGPELVGPMVDALISVSSCW